MAIRDKIQSEIDDDHAAVAAARDGRSITGYSGRQTQISEDALFGAPQTPIAAERVAPEERPWNQGLASAIENDPILARARANAVQRVPFGEQEQRLAYPKQPGFRLYWFNDDPGRVKRAQAAGYTFVRDEATNEPVAQITGKVDGRGRNSYLMKQPLEFYIQDRIKAARKHDERLEDIRRGRSEPEHAEGRYVPDGRIKISGR